MSQQTALDRDLEVPDFRSVFPDLPHGGRTLVAALVKAATPEQDLTVSEWADAYREVSPESGSPFPGRWRTNRVPYVREPQDCLHPDHPARVVTLKWSAQTGKSEVGVNWFGFIVDRAPGPTLTVLPTGDEAVKYNRVKLQPTIDASPRIRHRVKAENSRDEAASTTAFKRFAGGFNQITSATSSKGLQMVSIRWLIEDEIAGFPADTDGRGSPSSQARARQKAFGDLAKELAISTPGLKGSCEVSALFEAGDRRRCYVACPHCGSFQVLRYEQMQPPSESTGFKVAFACIAQGCIIEQGSRPAMLAGLRWVPTRVEPGEEPVPAIIAPEEIDRYAIPPCTGRVAQWQPSYALWAAYSPMESWTDIWQRGQAAKDIPLKEKVFTQQDLGEPYEELGSDVDPAKIAARAEDYPRGIVPPSVGRLVFVVDTQGDWLEWALYGFGPAPSGMAIEQWLIDAGTIEGDLETQAPWDELETLSRRLWPHACGGAFPADLIVIDTGGSHTQTVYKQVWRKPKWRPIKGASDRQAVMLSTPKRMAVKDKWGRTLFSIPLYLVGTHDLKLWIVHALKAIEEDRVIPGRLHLPRDIADETYCQGLTAEVLVPRERRDGRIDQEWHKRQKRNEPFDLAVYARAIAFGPYPNGLGVERITQEKWAEILAERHQAPGESDDLFAPHRMGVPAPAQAAPADPAEAAKPRKAQRLSLADLGRKLNG